MRFFVDEQACDQPPLLAFTFSTTNIVDLASKDKNFDMNSFIDQTITFDMNLRTYNSDVNFLDIKNSSIPIFYDKFNILEVKSSLPLPEHLKSILKDVIAIRSAISKFVFGQKYINFSKWQDKIQEPF